MRSRLTLLILTGLLVCLAVPVAAELSESTQEELAALNERVSDAGRLFIQKEFLECGDAIKEVQAKLEEMAKGSDAELMAVLKPIHARLEKAHALLELEGVDLPPLKPLTDKPVIPEGQQVSFVEQVAPVLLAKCGRCHISASRGSFNMKSFSILMFGKREGPVVVAGDDDSKLLDVIRSGEMPKGGVKITSEEFKTLKAWVQQGAVFDGDSRQTELAKLKPSPGE